MQPQNQPQQPAQSRPQPSSGGWSGGSAYGNMWQGQRGPMAPPPASSQTTFYGRQGQGGPSPGVSAGDLPPPGAPPNAPAGAPPNAPASAYNGMFGQQQQQPTYAGLFGPGASAFFRQQQPGMATGPSVARSGVGHFMQGQPGSAGPSVESRSGVGHFGGAQQGSGFSSFLNPMSGTLTNVRPF